MLVHRLLQKGYTEIKQNLEYRIPHCGGTLTGEVDVLAISPRGRYHFYEIKSCSHKIYKAKAQYDRFRAAYPYLDARGVYLSPRKVCLL
jgi:Holliday junction resolvase-like predicted endonuclease